jgi:hypothetical protein
MAEIVAVADFTPAAREPEDIAAPPARRQAHPGPKARDKRVSASVTESVEDMIASALGEAGRRDPQRARQRVFLVDGNKQQITAIEAQAGERGLKGPVLIDYIHVSGYIGQAAAALHPPPRPHRDGQGRHLPDEQPAAHEVLQGPREGMAHRHRHDRGSLQKSSRTDSELQARDGLLTAPRSSSSSAPSSSTATSTTT